VGAWNASRWSLYLALAGSLHCSALLLRGCGGSVGAASTLTLEQPLDPLEVDLTQATPNLPPSPAPGGGSIEPVPGPRVSAPEQRVKPSRPVHLVARAPEHQEQVETGQRREDALEPEPFATDLLASDESDAQDEVRPRAARRTLLANNVRSKPQGDPDAAVQVRSSSTFSGTGYGVNGGPGGLGRGTGRGAGVLEKPSAFGGPTGAFQADVCFIEPTVRLLTDITTCTPVATFFTSVLNVTPRRFDRGFPGLGRRTEWFAIKYHGKFRVQAEDSYTFRLLSDDGARLEIDGHQVLNNDGQHLPIAVSSNLRLDAGVHEFFLFYYQGPPDFVALQLFVKRFDHDEQLFGPVI
jgi:hypothetical protein